MASDQPRKSKIMVVDDSEVVRDATQLLLEDNGFDVVTVDTPIGASLIVSRELPQLVLVDVEMASLKGDHVVRMIKKNSRFADIRVLLYSDRPATDLEQIAKTCGADGYIQKSMPQSEIIRTLLRHLEQQPGAKPEPTQG